MVSNATISGLPGTPVLKIVIPGIPRTKKNSQNVVFVGARCPTCHKGKRAIITPSTAYKIYEKEAVKSIRVMFPNELSLVDQKVNIKCVYHFPLNKDGSIPKRIPDLTNLLEATDDILVSAKIVKDDNATIIASHDGSRVYFDNEDPRVEVEITKFEEE